jgi:hypothetical protein
VPTRRCLVKKTSRQKGSIRTLLRTEGIRLRRRTFSSMLSGLYFVRAFDTGAIKGSNKDNTNLLPVELNVIWSNCCNRGKEPVTCAQKCFFFFFSKYERASLSNGPFRPGIKPHSQPTVLFTSSRSTVTKRKKKFVSVNVFYARQFEKEGNTVARS